MLDPKFVITPAIALLSGIAVRSVAEPDRRDVVTTPPAPASRACRRCGWSSGR